MDRHLGSVRLSRWARTSLAAVTVAALGGPAVDATAAGSPSAAAAGCDPQSVVLPLLPGHGSGEVSAMNGQGWLVGISDSAAVLWRDTGTPLELGIGDATLANGDRTVGQPADVNEHGVIAVKQRRFTAAGTYVGSSALLWRAGVATRLPGRRALVEAINDRGAAVGQIEGLPRNGSRRVPVLWRHGVLTRLPLPRGTSGYATENNNKGLVVGRVTRDGGPSGPWWWRAGGGSGPLRHPRSGPYVSVEDVDDRGRIVGSGRSVLLWRRPGAMAKPIVHTGTDTWVKALDRRYLAGGEDDNDHEAFYAYRAWVGRLDGRIGYLPDPPTDDPDGFEGAIGRALSRGPTTFAPQGGVTVVGSARPWTGGWLPVAWTCAQTYLP